MKSSRTQKCLESYLECLKEIPLPFIITELSSGRIIEANTLFLEFFSFTREQAIGKTSLELGMWVNREQRGEFVRRLSESEVLSGFAADIRGGDGRVFRLIATSRRFESEGRMLLFSTFTDVTPIHRLEQELRESEGRYRSIFENRHTVMLIIDPVDGSIVDANPAASRFYGYDRDTLKSMSISRINTLTPEEIHAEMTRARDEKRNHFYFPHRLASGEVRDVEVYSGPITLGGRELLYSIVYDISEKRRAERDALDRMKELDRFFELCIDPLCIADYEGKIIRANPPWEHILARPLVQIEGSNFFQFVHPLDRERTTSALKQLEAGEAVYGFVNRYLRPDGTFRWLEWSATPFERSRIFAAARDVTEKIEREAELRKARDAAEEASRVKSRFLATMSHEIRTPLNAIIGFSSLAIDDHATSSCRDYFIQIRRASDTLLSVVNEILDFSRIESGGVALRSATFSPAELLQEISSTARGWIGTKEVILTTGLDHTLPPAVVGDFSHVRQILMNLVNNAVKFTEKGEITLSAARADSGDDDSRILIRFEVRDTGIGIPPGKIDSIFIPFSQADETSTRRYGGTGLGLSICRNLCELMGGVIDVRSTPGIGTTFSVTLPFIMPNVHIPADVERDSADLRLDRDSLAGRRILVAEDNPVNQLLMRDLLRRLGAEVLVASNGEEAVRMVRDDPAGIDLVLMDLEMPVMDGFQATGMIREMPDCSSLPVVALTAHAFDAEIARCREAGMCDCITKPIDLRSLAARLSRIIPMRRREGALPEQPHLPEIHGIDLADLLRRFDGNREVCIIVLRSFIENKSRFRETIAEALEAEDWTRCQLEAHSMKGVSANLSARHLHQLSVRIEQLVTLRDRDGIRTVLDEFDREFSLIAADVNRYLGSGSPE